LAAYCRDEKLLLVEDVAQCLGASVFGANGQAQPAGSWGDATAMSFYPTKTLGAAGDAGAVAFKDPRHAEKARLLRNHGYEDGRHLFLGHNSRMDELQACMLLVALDHFDEAIARRQAIASRYLDGLAECRLQLPRKVAGHAWNNFVIALDSPQTRQHVAAQLSESGVSTRIYYEQPLHQHEALRRWRGSEPLPHSERLAGCSLALPLYPLLSDEEVDYTAQALRRAVGAQG
jgi:dTDP-4-amino-4,6-dideoxygalactose transaminase